MATDYDYELNPPSRVKQARWATCWAAAFESIFATVGLSSQMTEAQLAARYGNARAGGGIRPGTLKTIADDFDFIANTWLDGEDTSIFTDNFVKERLRHNGPMLAACHVMNLGGAPGYHAQVIWGVHYLTNADVNAGDALLLTMNPANAKYELYPIGYFKRNTPLFTCWQNG